MRVSADPEVNRRNDRSRIDEAEMYYIDPVTCIDCSYCESVCPVEAIFDEFTMPPTQRQFIQINKAFFQK